MSGNGFAAVKKRIEDEGIRFIDLKMLDLSGRLHHLSFPASRLTESLCRNGLGFDGSSYGFLKVENSDMVLVPDLSTTDRKSVV